MISTFVCLARGEEDSQHVEGVQLKNVILLKTSILFLDSQDLGHLRRATSFLMHSFLSKTFLLKLFGQA